MAGGKWHHRSNHTTAATAPLQQPQRHRHSNHNCNHNSTATATAPPQQPNSTCSASIKSNTSPPILFRNGNNESRQKETQEASTMVDGRMMRKKHWQRPMTL
jgi:hypothetical protein